MPSNHLGFYHLVYRLNPEMPGDLTREWGPVPKIIFHRLAGSCRGSPAVRIHSALLWRLWEERDCSPGRPENGKPAAPSPMHAIRGFFPKGRVNPGNPESRHRASNCKRMCDLWKASHPEPVRASQPSLFYGGTGEPSPRTRGSSGPGPS